MLKENVCQRKGEKKKKKREIAKEKKIKLISFFVTFHSDIFISLRIYVSQS